MQNSILNLVLAKSLETKYNVSDPQKLMLTSFMLGNFSPNFMMNYFVLDSQAKSMENIVQPNTALVAQSTAVPVLTSAPTDVNTSNHQNSNEQQIAKKELESINGSLINIESKLENFIQKEYLDTQFVKLFNSIKGKLDEIGILPTKLVENSSLLSSIELTQRRIEEKLLDTNHESIHNKALDKLLTQGVIGEIRRKNSLQDNFISAKISMIKRSIDDLAKKNGVISKKKDANKIMDYLTQLTVVGGEFDRLINLTNTSNDFSSHDFQKIFTFLFEVEFIISDLNSI